MSNERERERESERGGGGEMKRTVKKRGKGEKRARGRSKNLKSGDISKLKLQHFLMLGNTGRLISAIFFLF